MSHTLNGLKKMLKKTDKEKSEEKALGYREIADLKTQASLSANLTIMINAARKVEKGLKRDFGEIERVEIFSKQAEIFIKNAQLRTEKILKEELSKTRPDFGFKNDKEYNFHIIAIEGYENFRHALPYFGSSIALEKNGELIAEIAIFPILDELFYAEKNRGTFVMTPRGSIRLRTSKKTEKEGLLVGTNKHMEGARFFGSHLLSMAYVASGRLEAAISPLGLPGTLLVTEAGGRIKEGKETVATNEKVFDTFTA